MNKHTHPTPKTKKSKKKKIKIKKSKNKIKNQKTKQIKNIISLYQHLTLDFTPLQQEEVLQYSIDKDGDASLQSFQCPSTYKEMIIIIHELRKQRHLALQSFEFNPPIIPLHSLNFPIPNSHISNSKNRNFDIVTSSSLITSEYDDV